MNKQELIEKYKNKCLVTTHFESMEMFRELWEDIKQLDEPQKVVVPQFIDEKIKYCKATDGYGLFHAMDYCYNFKECADWLESNEEAFAQAWIFGYEVEKDKRYLVKLQGIEKEKCYLNYNFGGVWLFYNQENFYGYRAHHTRKELEDAGFGWVFDCEGVEVEEVE